MFLLRKGHRVSEALCQERRTDQYIVSIIPQSPHSGNPSSYWCCCSHGTPLKPAYGLLTCLVVPNPFQS